MASVPSDFPHCVISIAPAAKYQHTVVDNQFALWTDGGIGPRLKMISNIALDRGEIGDNHDDHRTKGLSKY